MEDIQCIFCNVSSNQIVIEENGFKGRKCPKCGLIYISPRPAFTDILNLYSHDQAQIPAQSHISGSFVNRINEKKKLQILKRYVKKGSMLEIGAGGGYFLYEARKEGFEVYGIEFNTIQADFIRNKLGIPCEESPLDVSLYNEKKFDIIYHCDVISHFYNPVSEFQKINSMLRKDGIVVFETGNFGDVQEKYYKFYTKFQYPDHLFFFGENNLKELLVLTGFQILKIYRYSILPQLKIERLIKKLIYLIKSKEDKGKKDRATGISSSVLSGRSIRGFGLNQLLRNIFSYLSFFIRYRIGYLIRKKGRPQTIIIIAQKLK